MYAGMVTSRPSSSLTPGSLRNQPRPTSGTSAPPRTATARAARTTRRAAPLPSTPLPSAPWAASPWAASPWAASPWAASTTATTKAACTITGTTLRPGAVDIAARSNDTGATNAASTRVSATTVQHTVTPILVRRGTSAASARTASRHPTHTGAPRPSNRPVRTSRESTRACGNRPTSSSKPSPAPYAIDQSHHGASSTTGVAVVRTIGPHTGRLLMSPGASTDPARSTATTITTTISRTSGANAVTMLISNPERHAARQRRSSSGSAKPSMA